MAFSSAVGSFALPLATGNFTPVTGLAFGPAGYFLIMAQLTTVGYGSGLSVTYGSSSSGGTGESFSGSIVSDDNLAASDTGRRRVGSRVINGMSAAGALTLTREISSVTLDAGGFTCNNIIALGSQWLVNYFCLGGDVTMESGTVSTGIVDGATVDFTRTGFGTGVAVLAFTVDSASTSASDAAFAVGAYANGSQWSASWASQDAQAAANPGSVLRDNAVLACLDADNPGAWSFEMSFNSWVTDGVRLTVDNAPAAARDVHVIMLKGGLWDAGVETQQTSDTTKTTSGLVVIPDFGFFAGGGTLTPGTIETDADGGRFFVGFTDGTNSRGVSFHDVDAADPTRTEQSTYNDRVIRHHDADGGTNGDATIALSGSAGEFTATWSGTDGAAYAFGYLVGGDTAPSGAGGTHRHHANTLLGVG